MTETTDPVSDYETAKNAAIDARLRLEDWLKSLEFERQQIRALLGRTRKPRAAAPKPVRKPRAAAPKPVRKPRKTAAEAPASA